MTKSASSAEITRLGNGITVIVEPVESVRSIALGIFVDCGSAFESSAQNGISHFIEHMNFKGTAKRNAKQIAEELDSVGGKLNAYTSKEHTSYYSVVVDDCFDVALDLLADIFFNSKYEKKDIDTEKQVILQEIKMYEDSPDQYIHDLFVRNMWPGFYLGQPVIGSKEVVRKITKKAILKYISDHYLPEHITISVAGNCDKKEVLAKIDQYFGSFVSTTERVKSFPLPSYNPGINLVKKDTKQVHLCLGTRGISYHNPNRYPLLVLSNILGGSMSSVLFQEVREKRGLVYSIYSYPMYFRDCGLFAVYAGASMKNIKEVVQIILDTFRTFPNLINDENLQRAKNQLKSGLVLGLESSTSKMSWNGKNFFYYRKAVSIDEVAEEVDRIKKEDIIHLCKYLFDEKHYSLTAIGNFDGNPFEGMFNLQQ
ncbi:MAG: pitrilysin family protein [Candidatus Margulisbacteria bacterium]|nr:pitrilysin family protein [Candidatus Margulisiibacteriota bacterium]